MEQFSLLIIWRHPKLLSLEKKKVLLSFPLQSCLGKILYKLPPWVPCSCVLPSSGLMGGRRSNRRHQVPKDVWGWGPGISSLPHGAPAAQVCHGGAMRKSLAFSVNVLACEGAQPGCSITVYFVLSFFFWIVFIFLFLFQNTGDYEQKLRKLVKCKSLWQSA